MTTYHKEEIKEPMPLGYLYDQEHAASADVCLQELRQDYNSLVDAYDAERQKVQVLRDALAELVNQLHGIGIPDWHGAEGLSLEQSTKALAATEEN